ncbi:MAG: TenA family protein [Gammaproteobacteria bacterium]|nr:TenA family protein [Gammaproteobacteria bacterium]
MFEKLTKIAKPQLRQVLSHSFNTELFDGTLHSDNFRFFLANDAIYLRGYARLLNIIANRLDQPEHKSIFSKFSSETIETELLIHRTFEVEKLSTPCGSITEYLAHLDEHVNHSPISVGIASVLPCFWLYRELGKHAAIAQTNETHPYKLWVETYASPEFYEATELAIKTFDEIADIKYEQQTINTFLTSVEHEIAFWEESYSFYPRIYRFK